MEEENSQGDVGMRCSTKSRRRDGEEKKRSRLNINTRRRSFVFSHGTLGVVDFMRVKNAKL